MQSTARELVQRLEAEPGQRPSAARLMVSGGACDDLRIFDLIEHLDYSANLIFIDSCTATRYFWLRFLRAGLTSFKRSLRDTSAEIPCPAKDNVRAPERKKVQVHSTIH